MIDLSHRIEAALLACGRDRVFHNDGQPVSVAIRWRYKEGPDDNDRRDQWIVGSSTAGDRDEAGANAAMAFSKRLRERGVALIEWAEAIERALKTKPEKGSSRNG